MRVLHSGSIDMDLDLILTAHPKYLLTRSQPQKSRLWYRCPSLCFIFDHPEGRVLFDTSISPRWEEEWRGSPYNEFSLVHLPPEEVLEARLKQLGLGPEDFRYVIVSHLHTDHAGNLRLFEKAGVEIVVHEDELKGALSLERGVTMWGPGSRFGFVRRDFAFLPRRATTVYGDQELLRGLWVVSLPGHTWGSVGLLVRLERTGWVILAADALYHHESYGPPPVGSATTLFPDKWLTSVEKLRDLARRFNATIIPGHDETVIVTRPEGEELDSLRYAPDHVYD